MKKGITYILILLVVLVIGSCKKSAPTNAWTFEGTTFAADNVTYGNSMLEAFNQYSQYYLSFNFSAYPVAGSYLIVNSAYPAAGQVSITMGNVSGSTANYNATGRDSINATVTVANGKVSIIIPPVWMIAYSDSSKLTAHISQ